MKKHDSEFGRRPRWLVATAVLILALLAGGLWLVLPAQRPGDRPATLATDAAAAADAQPLRYDVEYPAVAYSERPRSNRVAALEARLMDGTVELEFRPGRGYLDSLLAALDIDVASQLLVFSKTSLLVRQIGPGQDASSGTEENVVSVLQEIRAALRETNYRLKTIQNRLDQNPDD